MHFYSHNIGDFALETRGLTYEQIGILITLLDKYAATERPIEEDWVDLAYQGASKCLARALLKAIFVKQGGGWVHLGIQKTISEYHSVAEKRRAAGRKGGKSRKSNTKESDGYEGGKQQVSKCQASNSQPITINQKPKTNNQGDESFSRQALAEGFAEPFTKGMPNQEQEQEQEQEGVGAPALRVPKQKQVAFPLTAESVPEEWSALCREMRPDLDPVRVFASFRFYWTTEKPEKKTPRGWSQTWRNWVKNERATQGSAASKPTDPGDTQPLNW